LTKEKPENSGLNGVFYTRLLQNNGEGSGQNPELFSIYLFGTLLFKILQIVHRDWENKFVWAEGWLIWLFGQ